jgi:colanic acid biosynthesis glycosyl transferase WcaI
MRILIHGINFAPELTGIGKYTGEMAFWLASRGHEVRVVTAPPYYPTWKIGEGYSGRRYRAEEIDGVRVFRCPLWIPDRLSGIRRILHLSSFASSSFPVLLREAALWKPDWVWVAAPALACAPSALLAARVAGGKSWLHVLDFEVDAAFDLGILPDEGPLKKGALLAERELLRRFDRASSISHNMTLRLVHKGVPEERVVHFPNWVDTDEIYPLAEESPLRRELGISPEAVVALYSGNMGEKQGLEILAEAAERLAGDPSIQFVFCGAGSGREGLERLCVGLKNVRFLPLQPLERLNDLLNLADIHLLPQRSEADDLVMPSKLTGMFASGRPELATAEPWTQVARVVEPCGRVTLPGDAGQFADAIKNLAGNPDERRRLGKKAREYEVREWSRDQVLEQFLGELAGYGKETRDHRHRRRQA